jgi:hypothetical protein
MRIKPNFPLKKIACVILGIYVIGVGQVNAQQVAFLDSGVDPQ